MNAAVDVESLHQLINELPPDALVEASNYLRSLKERGEGDNGGTAVKPQGAAQGLSEEFLQTFGAWKSSPLPQESRLQIIKERLAATDPALLEGDPSDPASCSVRGIPDEALATFGSWDDDGRSTEQIIEEIYSSRTSSDRVIDL